MNLPKYNNQAGTIELQGGIPGGITASKGLIAMFRFRVRAVGNALLKFLPQSKVLLNDGRATDALGQTYNSVYQLVLPPPEGPIVASETHPEQLTWYPNSAVALRWVNEGQTPSGYSYLLSEEPDDIPDNVSEGNKTQTNYREVSDGRHYFHIKSLNKDGFWGGVTHYALKIDTTPPAAFSIEIVPSAETSQQKPVIRFGTTDAHSGIDHYELKIVSLKFQNKILTTETGSPSFFDATSPYVAAPLELGTYDVIVRAYDEAGNYREENKRLVIENTLMSLIREEGFGVGNFVTVPWPGIWSLFALLIFIFGYVVYVLKRVHRKVAKASEENLSVFLMEKLHELNQYRNKYGKLSLLFLAFVASALFLGGPVTTRADDSVLTPPNITSVSKNISNDEIFYAGGTVASSSREVVLYLRNLATGETVDQSVVPDKKGNWFYRHTTPLSPGTYLLWAQSKAGEAISSPSPQIQFTVRRTSFKIGASRISYETLYLVILLTLAALLVGLVTMIFFYRVKINVKRKQVEKKAQEAEESIRRGFAVLRRDIQTELEIIRKAKLSKELSIEEKTKEEQLLKDLDWVQGYIGKEVWDIELTAEG